MISVRVGVVVSHVIADIPGMVVANIALTSDHKMSRFIIKISKNKFFQSGNMSYCMRVLLFINLSGSFCFAVCEKIGVRYFLSEF